jgi:hypothetical protein
VYIFSVQSCGYGCVIGHLQGGGEGDSISGNELLLYHPKLLAIRTAVDSGLRPEFFMIRTATVDQFVRSGYMYTRISGVEDVIMAVGQTLVVLSHLCLLTWVR